MRIFGKHVFPGQIILFASGLLFLASTTYDVHRSIKNNQTPPSQEQVRALQDYIKSGINLRHLITELRQHLQRQAIKVWKILQTKAPNI